MDDLLSMQIVQGTNDVPRDMNDLLIRHFGTLAPLLFQKTA